MPSPLAPTDFDLTPAHAFTFFVPCIPKAEQRAGRQIVQPSDGGRPFVRTFTPKRSAEFRAVVLQAACEARDRHVGVGVVWNDAVRVDIDAFFPPPYWMSHIHLARPVPMLATPDRDNLDKLFMDACTINNRTRQGLWHNDSIVCQGEVRKWYAATGHGPGIRVTVEYLLLPAWYGQLRHQHQQQLASKREGKTGAGRPRSESHIATELYEADALPRLARQMRGGGRRR